MEQRLRPDEEAWEPWESPYEQAPFSEAAGGMPPPGSRWDVRPIFMLLEAVRRGLPHELQLQFNSLIRELLLTLRSLIDWYLERLDGGKSPEPRVEDIPID